MKVWRRAHTPMLCGYDHRCVIQPGDPILVFAVRHSTRELIRCADHAGEPVPAQIGEREARSERLQIPDFTAVGRLSKDFDRKLAAAGRESDD